MKNTIKIPIILLIILMSLFIASCEIAPTADICVSIPPQAYLVKRIAGTETSVSIMIPPGAAPPTYAPTASQIRDLHECKLYVKNGHPDFNFEKMHIDPYLAQHPEILTVDMAKEQNIMPGDVHIWLSPKIMSDAAERIYEQLSKLYPKRKNELRSNLDILLRDIGKLDMELHAQLDPFQGSQFLTLHPSWGYFSRDYGIQQISIRHENKAPSTKEIMHLIEHAKETNIHIIFVQKEFSSEQLNVISRAINAKIITLDPLNESWLNNIRTTGKTLAKVFSEQQTR
ncbi:MAG: zinc ABC transporter substrate-binding protein [Candidatus Marinimicrobia bacterium]|nr:zinc ABC transporter substrate-binding protein [Candidatus Neomarinimicrobiota bacterium]